MIHNINTYIQKIPHTGDTDADKSTDTERNIHFFSMIPLIPKENPFLANNIFFWGGGCTDVHTDEHTDKEIIYYYEIMIER